MPPRSQRRANSPTTSMINILLAADLKLLMLIGLPEAVDMARTLMQLDGRHQQTIGIPQLLL